MTTSLKISIIVPSYNQGHFIEETLLSILEQDYSNIEIIVMDGGSTDNSVDVIRKYETRIAHWRSEKDSGQSEAINKGLRLATGDIVTWLNSDDRYQKGALSSVAQLFSSHPDIGFLHGKTRLFGDTIKDQIIGPDQDLKPHEYLPYMRFPQPSSFFRKDLMDLIGPVSEDLHYAMDFELVAKAIVRGAKPLRVSNLFSDYRMHAASKSNHSSAFLKEWTEVYNIVLHSVIGAFPYIEEMKRLGIAPETVTQRYEQGTVFGAKELEESFLQHIHLHFHHYYQASEYTEARKIARYLKRFYPQFYMDNQYKKFMFRMNFVPKFILALARKFN